MPGAGAGRAGWGSRKGSPAPPPLGESCGSRREACEYTQTLWSLPCKSWQDAASSELIHVRSPARPGHAGGDVPGAPRDPAPGGCPPLGSREKSSAHPSPLPPGPSYSSTVLVWSHTAFPNLLQPAGRDLPSRQGAGSDPGDGTWDTGGGRCDTGDQPRHWGWKIWHWVSGMTLGMGDGTLEKAGVTPGEWQV